MAPRAPMGRGATAFSARRARPAAGRRASPAVSDGGPGAAGPPPATSRRDNYVQRTRLRRTGARALGCADAGARHTLGADAALPPGPGTEVEAARPTEHEEEGVAGGRDRGILEPASVRVG